jgi:DNA-binding NarL/FixJ family response regulator
MYRTRAAALVITDLRMPEKNGLETIQELKQEFPEAKIIAMSGQVDPQNDLLLCAQRLGATRTLPKPLDFAQVLATIQDVLQA